MDIFFELIGYLGGICLAISFIPQAIKTYKTKDVRALSFFTYSIYNLGVFCWVVYGFYLHSYQMVIFNVITLSFSFPILLMILKYKK